MNFPLKYHITCVYIVELRPCRDGEEVGHDINAKSSRVTQQETFLENLVTGLNTSFGHNFDAEKDNVLCGYMSRSNSPLFVSWLHAAIVLICEVSSRASSRKF